MDRFSVLSFDGDVMEQYAKFAMRAKEVIQNLRKENKIDPYKWECNWAKGCECYPGIKSAIDEVSARPELSDGERVIELRKKIAKLWADEKVRFDIVNWVVTDWGKIDKIQNGTLKKFRDKLSLKQYLVNEYLRSNVASYSKCLAFICPSKYYIYDSRVALTLNALSFALGYEKEVAFQNPASKSVYTKIIAKAVKIKSRCSKNNYRVYCATLRLMEGIEPEAVVAGLSEAEELAAFTKVLTSARDGKDDKWNVDAQLKGHFLEQDLFMLADKIREGLKKNIVFRENGNNGKYGDLILQKDDLRVRLQNLLLISSSE